MINYEIRNEWEHYSVYIDDDFYCSADTYEEAFKEVESVIHNIMVNEND